MNESLNGWERLKKAFESFEPDVTGNWGAMKSKLEGSNGGAPVNDYFVRRAKAAERFAIGATAVALGMAFMISQQQDDRAVVKEEVHLVVDVSGELQRADHTISTDGVSGKAFHQSSQNLKLLVMQDANEIAELIHDGSLLKTKPMANTSNTYFVDAASDEVNKALEIATDEVESGTKGIANEIAALVAGVTKRVERNDDELSYMVGASVQEACAGTEVEFTLRGLMDQGSVLWNFGDGSFSQSDAPVHVFDDAGTYDITVSIRDHGDGTIRTRTVENMIVIRPKPEAKMDWSIATEKLDLAAVNFMDLTENASSSMWLLNENEMEGSAVDLKIPGDYNVNLVASNKFGCQDIKSEVVQLGDRHSANAPAIFSPNNDGRYDFFLPLIAHELDGDWNLVIYDSKGKIAFETNQVSRPWNGVFDTGVFAEDKGNYRWELAAENSNGNRILFSDQIKVEK